MRGWKEEGGGGALVKSLMGAMDAEKEKEKDDEDDEDEDEEEA